MSIHYLFLALGIGIGFLASAVLSRKRVCNGALKIDKSDPEKDLYRIEIEDLDELEKRKYVWLKVIKTTTISQN